MSLAFPLARLAAVWLPRSAAEPEKKRIATIPSSPMRQTLRRVVVLSRVVGWAWSLAMVIATLGGPFVVREGIVVLSGVVATVWTAITVVGSREDRFLSRRWFVVTDGVVAFLLAGAAVAAGTPDFISGGYPMSWLFVVAYATALRPTMLAAAIVTGYAAVIHLLLSLGTSRTIGSIQFLVVGLIAGWAFDSLRNGEAIRLRVEAELRAEQAATTRHDERARLARQLHDSVLQTLQMIRAHAYDGAEVRYLARRQERELRRTIDEYRSPHERSFRAELLGARDRVEDMCRIEIEAVVRDDAPLDAGLAAAIEAAGEAMMNAAKHSGARQIHLYSELNSSQLRINIRDRGHGISSHPVYTPQWLAESIRTRLLPFGGSVEVTCPVQDGTDVSITLDRS